MKWNQCSLYYTRTNGDLCAFASAPIHSLRTPVPQIKMGKQLIIRFILLFCLSYKCQTFVAFFINNAWTLPTVYSLCAVKWCRLLYRWEQSENLPGPLSMWQRILATMPPMAEKCVSSVTCNVSQQTLYVFIRSMNEEIKTTLTIVITTHLSPYQPKCLFVGVDSNLWRPGNGKFDSVTWTK